MSKRRRVVFDVAEGDHGMISALAEESGVSIRELMISLTKREMWIRSQPKGSLYFIKRPDEDALIEMVFCSPSEYIHSLKESHVYVKKEEEDDLKRIEFVSK